MLLGWETVRTKLWFKEERMDFVGYKDRAESLTLGAIVLMSFRHSVVSNSLWPPPWTVAHQAPLSMGFSRHEYQNGLPSHCPEYLNDPWVESLSPESPALAGGFFTSKPPGTAPLRFSSVQFSRGQVILCRGGGGLCSTVVRSIPSFWPLDGSRRSLAVTTEGA